MSSQQTGAATDLPLADLHRRLGATLTEFSGFAAPADYGSFEGELRALSERAAWVDRGWVDRLELTGVDRARLLNGMVTCEVKELAAGRGAYGFFTGKQGKILADVLVLALEDRLWLELPPGTARPIREHIEKYIIADQVEVMPLADMLPISIIGPESEEVLSTITTLPPLEAATRGAGTTHGRVTLLGTEVHCVRRAIAGLPACTLWASASIARPFLDELLAETNLPAAGWRALEAQRIVAGHPAFGLDFTGDHFPQESGREAEGVSYTKGCYLGQEIVARIHYRGGVHRAMCRLRFEGPAPVPGTPLMVGDKEVGRVGSAVVSPLSGEAVGLAVIHRHGYEPEAHLRVADGEGAGGQGAGGRAEVMAVLADRTAD